MRIAITGGIADGKTTVCNTLRELGYKAISADEIVRELYNDEEISRKIGELAAELGIANERESIRRLIAENAEPRRRLNAILHPRTIARILEETEGAGVHFAEVPLLIETATQGLFDEVWVVSAGPEEQRRRLIERLGSDIEADAMLGTQLPTEAKIPFADRVIRTNGPVETVKSKIGRLVEELTERASRT